MTKNNRYLLLQSIENSNNYAFESAIETALKKKVAPEDIMVVDNLSDAISLDHAARFIKESDGLTVIIDELKTDSTSLVNKIMNQIIRKPNTQLYCLRPVQKILPFLKLLNGQKFEEESSLLSALG